MKTVRRKTGTAVQKTYDQIPLGVVRVNRQRTISYANPVMRALIGTDPVGANFLSFVDRETDRARLKQEFRKRFRGQASQYEIELRRPADGRHVPISISAAPEFDARNNPVGSLAFIRDLSFERANDKIHRAIEREATTKGLFDALCREIGKLIPHDAFRVTLVSDDRDHLASIYAKPAQADELTVVKWWPMPPVAKEYLKRRKIHDLDVDKWFARADVQEQLRSDPATRIWRERERVKHILVYPVLRDNMVSAFVALERRGAEPFDAEQLRLCEQLPIAEVVISALQIARRRELEFVMNLIRDLGNISSELSQVARTLVDQVQAHYRWEHVSLFQVDEQAGMLRMLTQAGIKGARIEDGYAQPLNSGFLGRAYDGGAGRPINVGNVHAKKFHGIYLHGIKLTKSEMCLPVPGSKVRWILNVEAGQQNAFAREDRERVRAVLREAGFALERTALLGIKQAIASSIKDAVIQTDDTGVILEVNPAAGELLGAEAGALVGRQIADFVEGATRDAVAAASDFPRTEMVLKPAEGHAFPALLSCARLPPELGGKVFVASDLSFQKRMEQSELMKDVFWQVAQETRTPLALVSSWLRRAAASGEGERAEILDKAQRQLRKMDVTLERVLRVTADLRGESSSRTALDLGALVDELVDELPHADAQRIDRAYGEPVPAVMASREDLEFCVQNLVGVMMRSSALDEKLWVATHRQADSVLLELRNVARDPARRRSATGDREDSSIQRRTEIASGLDLVRNTLRRMGGELEPGRGEQESFTIRLPLAN